MKKLLCALVISAVVVPGIAFAGSGGTSCATAQEIFPSSNYAGDTSANTNFIGAFGPLPSPGPDAVYKFTSDGQATGTIDVALTGSWNGAIIMTGGCGGNAGNPIQAATGPGASISMPVDNGAGAPLTAGTTYYVYITGNPSDNSGPSGPYTFATPNPLPVTLQSFSIN
jgi:hypothetical protein